MLNRKIVVAVIAVCCFITFPVGAQEQETADVPRELRDGTIRLIVPWGTGGGSDQMARALARAIEKQTSLSIAVINKPGGNGTVGLRYALQQPADGHTIAVVTNDLLVNHVLGVSTVKPEDFEYIARVVSDVNMLFARSGDTNFEEFQDYVEAAKAEPGQVSVATAGKNGIEQLSVELVNRVLGLSVKWVPYNKPGERVAAFLGGHVDLVVEQPAEMQQHVEEGNATALVQMAEERASAFPNTPTAKEVGADVTLGLWRGVAVRRGTDSAVRSYLVDVVGQAVRDEEFRSSYVEENLLDIRPGYLPGDEFERAVEDEEKKLSRILNEA